MHIDPKTIARKGGTEILEPQHVVRWPDGTNLALHPVRLNGADDMWRRAIQLPGGAWLVADLRRVCPPLREELPMLMPRDHQGCVMHRMRLDFGDAGQVICRFVNAADIAIMPAPDHAGYLPHAEAA